MNTAEELLDEARVQHVRCTVDRLVVDLDDGREISVPIRWYPRLLAATPEQRQRWQLAGAGFGIHWPDIDEDLSVRGLLLGQPSPGVAKQPNDLAAARAPGLEDINIMANAPGIPPEDARQREAKAALDRVQRDQEGIFTSSMARASDHFSGKDAPPDDNIELWGRRIGRSLSLIAVVVLAYLLGVQLRFW